MSGLLLKIAGFAVAGAGMLLVNLADQKVNEEVVRDETRRINQKSKEEEA